MHQLQAHNIKFDSSLLKDQEKLFYYKFNIIPWQKFNNITFFIVEDIRQDINLWIEANYGIDYVLIKIDSVQSVNLLNSHFGILEFANNYL